MRKDRATVNRLVSMFAARLAACCVVAVSACLAGPASGYVLTITPGVRSIYLQVGVGTYIGGNYNVGGVPANNATVNLVSVTVPAASVGNGVAQTMTSNSATANSFYDGFKVCNPPAQVYIGAWSRPGVGTGTAVLTVTSPATLTSGADTIPFSQITWTSTANGDPTADIAAGTFNGGTLTLANIPANRWLENCFTYSYANSVFAAAGSYTGRAVFTLSLP